MSLFADVNFDEGSDNPLGIDPGTHEVTISDAKIADSESGNTGLWLTFTNDKRQTIRKWVTMPKEDQDDETRARNTSFLRLLLRNLEIPSTRWNALEPNDFIGLDCVIIVVPQKDNPDFNQVKKISRSKGSGSPGVSYGKEWSPADLPKHPTKDSADVPF